MPLDIDGYAVLGAIARRPDVFPAVKSDVGKAARALVVKQLKDKALTADTLRSLVAAIQVETFDLVLDALSDTDVKSLLAKVDKFNPDVKAAEAQVHRKQLANLAKGLAAPTAKPVAIEKAPKAPKPPKAAVERAGNSKAMSAKKRSKKA